MNTTHSTKKKVLTWFFITTGALISASVIITGSKIFFFPLLLLAIFAWIRFATKHPVLALIIIVCFTEECFDITTFGLRKRFLSDLGIILTLPLIIINIRRVWSHIVHARSSYAIAILLFFCAIIISLYAGSYTTFGQPMSTGLTVARKYLFFLSYFFLVAVNASREDCFLFLKYLAWLGAAIAFLSIVEVALGGGVIFSHYYAVGQERAGMLRIHIGSFLIVFSIFYSFLRQQNLAKAKKERLVYIGLTGLGLFTLGFIVMTRAIILGITLTFVFWLLRKTSSKRIMFFCATVSFLILVILSGISDTILSKTFVGEIINKTSTELTASTGNISIRKDGVKYYLDLMRQTAPLSGVGLFSDTNYPHNPMTIAADTYHYYIVDTNSIATLVYFGFQGLLLLTFFVIKTLRDSMEAIKFSPKSERYNYEVLFFIFLYTLFTPTLNNIIVERMLIYSGVFFYLLFKRKTNPEQAT